MKQTKKRDNRPYERLKRNKKLNYTIDKNDEKKKNEKREKKKETSSPSSRRAVETVLLVPSHT